MENPRVELHEHEVLLPDGDRAWQQWINHIVAQDGVSVELQGSGRDVTERRRAEDSLRQALLEVERLKEQLHAENEYLREAVGIGQELSEAVGETPKSKSHLTSLPSSGLR